MENVSVQLRGINRTVAAGSGQDGYCMGIANMRYKDGAWRLAGEKILTREIEPTQAAEILNCSNLLYHNDHFEGVIGSDNTTGDVIFFNFEDENKATLVDIDYAGGERVNEIKKFGKFLFVATNKDRYIFKWDDDIHFYVAIPNVPRGQFAVWDGERQPQYTEANPEFLLFTDSDEPADEIISYIKKMIFEHGKEGLFEGHVFFRFAYRLFDNSLVNHSGIYYAHIGYSNVSLKVLQLTAPAPAPVSYRVYDYLMNNPLIEMTFSDDELTYFEAYKGIIRSLEVYMTAPISAYDFTINEWDEWTNHDSGSGYNVRLFPLKNSSEFENMFRETRVFYKVSSYDIEEILLWDEVGSSGYRRKTDSLIIENIHAIETREAMEVDNFTHHHISGAYAYDYNSRLHLGDTFTRFAQPINNGRKMLVKGTDAFNTAKRTLYFGTNMAQVLDYLLPFDVYLEVDIETEEGSRMTRVQVPDAELEEYGICIFKNTVNDDHYFYLLEVLSYPDIRARYLRVCAKIDNTYMSMFGVELKEHLYLNCAYYQTPFQLSGNGHIGITYFQVPDIVTNDHTFRTENNILRDSNRVQVSELGNIFVYPAKNSYRIGQKSNAVVALGSMSSPMSEGQFGQYPVHVFTSSGIYNMNQGSGDVLYANVQRFSLDVLDNKNNLIELGGAVVFVSRGALYLLAGSEKKRISLPLEAKQLTETPPADQFGLNEAGIVAMGYVLWDSFLSGAAIAFDHDENELLVSNTANSITFAFQLSAGIWYIRGEAYKRFVMGTDGKYLGITSGGSMYDMTVENETSNHSRLVCFVTRPMLFGIRGYKKVRRLIARMVFDVVSGSSVMLGLYGSLNGRDWELLRKVSYDNGINDLTINDLMIKETHASAKYFILSFSAIVGNDFELTVCDATVEQKYGRKLR